MFDLSLSRDSLFEKLGLKYFAHKFILYSWFLKFAESLILYIWVLPFQCKYCSSAILGDSGRLSRSGIVFEAKEEQFYDKLCGSPKGEGVLLF